MGETKEQKLARLKQELESLTDNERYILFHAFCIYCGDKDPHCQCWNDE